MILILYGLIIAGLILWLTALRVGYMIARRQYLKEQLRLVMQSQLDDDRNRPVSKYFQQRASKQLHRD